MDGKRTINVVRAFHLSDLTVECIRRHDLVEHSPLGDVLARYEDFFGLFGDFSGYVEFSHLQDLVTDDSSAVRFCMPFEDFRGSPLPGTLDVYLEYHQRATHFMESA